MLSSIAFVASIVIGLVAVWYGAGIATRRHLDRRLRKATAGKGILALTYDDGPGPETTPALLDLLDEQGVKAMFFLVGENAHAMPELVDRIEQEGHTICWHSRSHCNQWRLGPLRALFDLSLPGGPIGSTIARSNLFRAPYGKLTLATVAACFFRGWRIIGWTHPAGDTYRRLPSPENVVARIREDGGGVVLMHDMDRADPRRPEFVLETTRSLIRMAKVEGWRMVHSPDELAQVA